MSAATSPALTLPELPVVAWMTDDGRVSTDATKREAMPRAASVSFHIALVLHSDALTYGQQCAQAQGEAQAAEIARLRAFVEKVHDINENGLYREEIQFEGSGRYAVDIDAVDELGRLCAALKSEAA